MLALGTKDELPHFCIDLNRLDVTADLVADTTRAAYPSLEVPLHSRWRHFEFQGVDRWAALAGARSWTIKESARAAFDLAFVSVLLDAGAGTRWHYLDRRSGATIGRSEGLALATLTMFEEGAFSADSRDPLRVDGAVLRDLSAEKFRRAFQINDANPLVGLGGRIGQLRRFQRRVKILDAGGIAAVGDHHDDLPPLVILNLPRRQVNRIVQRRAGLTLQASERMFERRLVAREMAQQPDLVIEAIERERILRITFGK